MVFGHYNGIFVSHTSLFSGARGGGGLPHAHDDEIWTYFKGYCITIVRSCHPVHYF